VESIRRFLTNGDQGVLRFWKGYSALIAANHNALGDHQRHLRGGIVFHDSGIS
jgi:hypothetical protein